MKQGRENYQRLMEARIGALVAAGRTREDAPTLLLHSCCGPCSTAVIACLSAFFRITVFYFNPNIDERDEYAKRAREQERLLALMPTPNPVSFLEGDWEPKAFIEATEGHWGDGEGGERCTICYCLRLDKTAEVARARDFEFFTTTLSVSPMKDAERINRIGSECGARHGVEWLWSDFKKKGGYQKSIELSKTYSLYRQNYCGCSFSRRAADREMS